MSDLLNKASLVMIPSGYKEDVVYSAVPSDGSGDLAFSRASNGTRVNSAGLVEVCPWNLVQYSEDFANAAWTKVNATITANSTTAPNGTNTATKFESIAAGQPQLVQSFTGVNTISIYAKAGNISSFSIWIGSAVTFDLSSGTVTAGTATMENVGNGWFRCIISSTNAGAFNPFFSASASGQFIYIWGAQVNIGSTAKPYFPTTDRLNVPRLTYQNGGGGCPSLLLEKQSTNVLTYSEDFTQADWPKQNTIVTANATTSPDGTQNADKLIANTTNARHLIFQAITTSNTHTFTTYAKAGENSFLIMRLDTDSPEIKTWFNLSNGTIGTSAGGSPTITSVGNGWYRCSVQYTPSTSSNIYAVLYTAKTDGVEGFAGNDSDGTYIWGAQSEASSYATSLINTNGASATRVADACFKTGISSLIGQSEGTIFADINPEEFQEGSYIGITDGTITNRIIFGFEGGSVNSGSLQVYGLSGVNGSGTYTRGQRMKIALAYKSGNSALFVNGSLISTSTSTFSGSFSRFRFDSYAGTQNFIGKVSEAILFSTRLTNAELASLTTI
jgi:hypothetical protein